MSAWADLYDARARLAHLLTGQGLSAEEVAEKLSVDQVDVGVMLAADPEPWQGSSRWQCRALQQRVHDLEGDIRNAAALRIQEANEDKAKRESDTHIRELLRDPDPKKCGCRHWKPHPSTYSIRAGFHHPQCPEGGGPPELA